MAIKARKPEQRLRAFLGHCQGRKECPYTNAPQPSYRMDGMKIMMEFPKPKTDDDLPPEQADRKQVPFSLWSLHPYPIYSETKSRSWWSFKADEDLPPEQADRN